MDVTVSSIGIVPVRRTAVQQPADECDLADESERRDRRHIAGDEDRADSVDEVAEACDGDQDPDPAGHEAGAERKVTDQQQVSREQDESEAPDGVVPSIAVMARSGSLSSPRTRASWAIATTKTAA